MAKNMRNDLDTDFTLNRGDHESMRQAAEKMCDGYFEGDNTHPAFTGTIPNSAMVVKGIAVIRCALREYPNSGIINGVLYSEYYQSW
jgi:hypothetical protein